MFEYRNGKYITVDAVIVKNLQSKIYMLEYDSQMYKTGARPFQDKFDIPKNLYFKDDGFVENVVRYFQQSDKGFGVLMNGVKGNGKTIEAKMICNQIDLPVFLITNNNPNMDSSDIATFLSKLSCDCVIFFDEYDKMFKEHDTKFLSIMDGVLSNLKILWILTTNEKNISQYMINRPGRIRYIKEYTELTDEQIKEIINSVLNNNNQFADEAFELLSKVEDRSIDIILEFCNEIKWRNISPSIIAKTFNLFQAGHKSKSGNFFRK